MRTLGKMSLVGSLLGSKAPGVGGLLEVKENHKRNLKPRCGPHKDNAGLGWAPWEVLAQHVGGPGFSLPEYTRKGQQKKTKRMRRSRDTSDRKK